MKYVISTNGITSNGLDIGKTVEKKYIDITKLFKLSSTHYLGTDKQIYDNLYNIVETYRFKSLISRFFVSFLNSLYFSNLFKIALFCFELFIKFLSFDTDIKQSKFIGCVCSIINTLFILVFKIYKKSVNCSIEFPINFPIHSSKKTIPGLDLTFICLKAIFNARAQKVRSFPELVITD